MRVRVRCKWWFDLAGLYNSACEGGNMQACIGSHESIIASHLLAFFDVAALVILRVGSRLRLLLMNIEHPVCALGEQASSTTWMQTVLLSSYFR